MKYLFEAAVIYAAVHHKGQFRKLKKKHYLLHPMEVAQILSTMTDDEEILAAGILHDVAEDTKGTVADIRRKFGKRVAMLVESETEKQYPGENREDSWKKRKEESLQVLKDSTDKGVKMLWLADKLANIRSLSQVYSEEGDKLWTHLNQQDPELHRWYYKTVAEYLEMEMNRTGAYKELIRHINSIWPGTFPSAKERYRNYRTVSLDNCRLIGQGAQGEVYRYDDELIIKVYHRKNLLRDVEREILMSRKAFLLGLPTAISFGIVSVGNRYGAVYELIHGSTVSDYIAKDPQKADYYGKLMAELACRIHATEVEDDEIPSATDTVRTWIRNGIEQEEPVLAARLYEMVEKIADNRHLIHGDFHTGNVFYQDGELFLIDLDRLSTGHPVIELSGVYMAYVAFGERNPSLLENYMGFSCDAARRYFDAFMQQYLGTTEPERLREVTEKAALLCYVRMFRRFREDGPRNPGDTEEGKILLQKIRELAGCVENLDF